MDVVSVTSAVLHLALFIGGMVVALTLRRRYPGAMPSTMLGFGCMLLASIIAFGEGLGASRIAGAASSVTQAQTIFLILDVVIRLIELAGLAVIFFGLLRVVRRRDPHAPGTWAGR